MGWLASEPRPGWHRFWSRVQVTDSCWLWTGGLTCYDYGSFSVGSDKMFAHRVVWEWLVGPLRALTIDHLCRVRNCVRLDHLEAVTLAENGRRGYLASAEGRARVRADAAAASRQRIEGSSARA